MDSHHKKIIDVLCSCKGEEEGKVHFKNLQELGKKLNKDIRLQKLDEFLGVLANKDRLKIIHVLSQGNLCVCELEAILDKSQPAISHHLKQLEKANLIRGWKKGRFTHYDLRKENFQEFYQLISQEFKKIVE